jgi:protease IV
MRRFLVGFLATVGFLAIVVAGAAVGGVWWAIRTMEPPPLPERIALTVDLRAGIDESLPDNPLEQLRGPRRLAMSDLLVALDEAARDDRVRVVVLRLAGTGPNLAQAQELVAAVGALREAGKPVIAQAETFGELGTGTLGYYVASAADEIHLQPVGLIGLTGLGLEMVFARDLLDEIGIEPDFTRREAYKTGLDSFVESGLTEPNREMLISIADSLYGQILARIAAGRGLDEGAARRLVDGGPYYADEALERGLVDRLGWRDETLDRAREQAGEGAETVTVLTYHRRRMGEIEDEGRIAVVHGDGLIQPGSGPPGLGGITMNADRVALALRDAVRDDDVRAILFRLDSGGGSAVASETIARELRRAREAGKPVIVSMAQAAASGGYWVAMDAEAIVSAPATLTGSIGVIAGKPVVAGLLERLEINVARIERGANAAMWSNTRRFDARGRARLEALVDRLYDSFIDGVALARGLDAARVRELAGGRVYTGEQALGLGLVDHTGGFQEALGRAKEAAGLARTDSVRLRPFPEPRDPVTAVLELLELPSVVARAVAVLAPALAPAMGGGTAQAPWVGIE